MGLWMEAKSMKPFTRSLSLLLLIMPWLPFAAIGESAPLIQARTAPPRDVSALLQPILSKYKVPAVGVAIVSHDGIVAIGMAGVRSWGGNQPVTNGDQWHLGSCTKAMTATLAARLIDRGLLKWETTIGEVFGAKVHPAWQPVQLVWLLSHRSGASLNFDQALWERMVARGGTNREQRRFFVNEGLSVPPSTTPNAETHYSNAGFMIAGAMLEIVADRSWEELMHSEVFGPLNMTQSGFGVPGSVDKQDQPVGHVRDGNAWSSVGFGINADNPAASGPAGTVHASLGDWGRFVAAHLRGSQVKEAQGESAYLKPATWERLHTMGGADWGYSPGWVVTKADWAAGVVLQHLGSNGFWLSQASLALNKDVAVLIVSNAADDTLEPMFNELLTTFASKH